MRATAASMSIFIHALSENTAMLQIVRDAGATVEREGSESEAWLTLPPDSFASHLDELLGDTRGRDRLPAEASRPSPGEPARTVGEGLNRGWLSGPAAANIQRSLAASCAGVAEL